MDESMKVVLIVGLSGIGAVLLVLMGLCIRLDCAKKRFEVSVLCASRAPPFRLSAPRVARPCARRRRGAVPLCLDALSGEREMPSQMRIGSVWPATRPGCWGEEDQ